MRCQMNKPENELQKIKVTSHTTTTLQMPPSGMLPEGGNLPCRNSPGVWRERRKAWPQRRIKVVRERVDDDGSSVKWPTQKLYWLHKIGRTAYTICINCGVGEETGEHVVYDCPWIHHTPCEPTPPDTSERSTNGFAHIGEAVLCPRSTRCLIARNHHHLIYPSSLLQPHPPICPSHPILIDPSGYCNVSLGLFTVTSVLNWLLLHQSRSSLCCVSLDPSGHCSISLDLSGHCSAV